MPWKRPPLPRTHTPHVNIYLFTETDSTHVRCALCRREIGYAGNWGGGVRKHGDMHVRRGEATLDESWWWRGRRIWAYYYLTDRPSPS